MANSYQDKAGKISWYYSRPNQDELSFSPDSDEEYAIQRYHQDTLEKIECTLGVCQSTFCSWEPRQLHVEQRLFHRHLRYSQIEDNNVYAVLMLSRVVHSCLVQLSGGGGGEDLCAP